MPHLNKMKILNDILRAIKILLRIKKYSRYGTVYYAVSERVPTKVVIEQLSHSIKSIIKENPEYNDSYELSYEHSDSLKSGIWFTNGFVKLEYESTWEKKNVWVSVAISYDHNTGYASVVIQCADY